MLLAKTHNRKIKLNIKIHNRKKIIKSNSNLLNTKKKNLGNLLEK